MERVQRDGVMRIDRRGTQIHRASMMIFIQVQTQLTMISRALKTLAQRMNESYLINVNA